MNASIGLGKNDAVVKEEFGGPASGGATGLAAAAVSGRKSC